jgi:ABC-type glycerol-3-phosphate transport system substrate-binding protein
MAPGRDRGRFWGWSVPGDEGVAIGRVVAEEETMPVDRISRRNVIKGLAAGAAGAALLPAGVGATGRRVPNALAFVHQTGDYQGKFVIVSTANPDQNAPLIQAIEAAHAGVKVEWRFLPSERFVELFTASEVAGDQIDLMDLNGQDLRRYAVGGRLKDLSGVAYKDRFQDVALATYTIHGQLWALPRGGISGFTFFYNKKALEKVGVTTEPQTYDELVAMAPALDQAGYAPFVHPGKNIYLWPVWQFWAHAQTSGNKAIENTIATLTGELKFTAPEHVQALEILNKFAQDKLFIKSVNSLERDAAWLLLTQGKAAFFYDHSSRIGSYSVGEFPDLDLGLIQPVRAVPDPNVARQLPGGTGSALGMYAKIAAEREEIAASIMDLMTSDEWVKWSNDLNKDPVSCNKNVQASDDPLALKYARECSPNQITYLDWLWPPEITRAFQENQQAIVAGDKKPDEAAQAIEGVMDQLRKDGYTFEA